MRFQVGKFTCELARDDDGRLQMRWIPEPPKYLNRAERRQYQAGRAAFLESLKDHDQPLYRPVEGSTAR